MVIVLCQHEAVVSTSLHIACVLDLVQLTGKEGGRADSGQGPHHSIAELRERLKKDGSSLFTRSHTEKTRDNRYWLHQGGIILTYKRNSSR